MLIIYKTTKHCETSQQEFQYRTVQKIFFNILKLLRVSAIQNNCEACSRKIIDFAYELTLHTFY